MSIQLPMPTVVNILIIYFIDEPGELLYTIDSVIDPTCSPDWSYSNGSICITITGGTNPSPIGAGWTSLGGGVWCLENISAGTYTIDVDDANNCSTNTIVPMWFSPDLLLLMHKLLQLLQQIVRIIP